jgi:DNA sulfur modification protein DndC
MRYEMYSAAVVEALDRIQLEYERATVPWFIGFSGGKDSSAVLKLVFQALLRAKPGGVAVHVVYCDTGVEIPVIRAFVHQVLARLSGEATRLRLPVHLQVALPPVRERFFVKVIGRGYPPPSNRFRWCTDRLRVAPVRKLIAEVSRECQSKSALVLLGLRRGESGQRDRTLDKHGTDDPFFQSQAGSAGIVIFSPIIKFTLSDVWTVIDSPGLPYAVDGKRLRFLYRSTDGECPVVRESTSKPCAGNRFGCWTCTVVRRDRAVEGLIAAGEPGLAPLLGFRNWLAEVRNEPSYRELLRRNGAPGPGPFTLAARREILRRLLAVQGEQEWTLIAPDEIELIKELWIEDEMTPGSGRKAASTVLTHSA